MNPPELQQLYRRYQRYEQLAKHYGAVLEGLQSADITVDPAHGTVTFHTTAFSRIPKSIPRGKPMQWYVDKYRYYSAKASDTGDLYWSLADAAKKRGWEALSREGKLATLHEIGGRITTIEGILREYRAKIPAWERELAEHGPISTTEDQVWAWVHAHANPHAMVKTMTKALQDAESERDWLLDHL
jgi:hypothetical protein